MFYMTIIVLFLVEIFVYLPQAQELNTGVGTFTYVPTQPIDIPSDKEQRRLDDLEKMYNAFEDYKHNQKIKDQYNRQQRGYSRPAPILPTYEYFPAPRYDSSDCGPTLSDYERIKTTSSATLSDDSEGKPLISGPLKSGPELSQAYPFDIDKELKEYRRKKKNLERTGIFLREAVPLSVGTGLGAAGYFFGSLFATSIVVPTFIVPGLLAGIVGGAGYVALRLGAKDYLENCPNQLSVWIDDMLEPPLDLGNNETINPSLVLTPECKIN